MRLLIVDDERIERKGLMKMIQTEMPEVTIVGEARNGRIAIELADELRPDVMMMDIKMPGMDGIEAVKTIRQRHRHMKFIMVSAFNTFEYAKEVMQEGVKEYILKPSRKEEVLAALKRVKADLLEQQKQQVMEENYSRALSLMESSWLSSLLLEQVEDLYLEEWSELLNFQIGMGLIVLFSIKGDPNAIHNRNYFNWLKERKHSGEYEMVVGPIIDEKVPVLLLIKEEVAATKVKTDAKQFCRSIILSFQEQFAGVKLLAGIGLPYSKMEEFSRSYHEASVALEQVRKEAAPYLFFSERTTATETRRLYDVENRLLEYLKMGDYPKVLLEFEGYYQELIQNSKLVVVELEKLFEVIARECYKLGYPFEVQTIFEPTWAAERVYETAKARLSSCMQGMVSFRQPYVKGMLQKAKDMIDRRYKEALSLEEVAEFVGVTPFYFSKVFKEKMGVTFIDYLTDLRIMYAKGEMIKTEKSLKEICFEAGYNDPNYFSRVFKKKTGITPKEFRHMNIS